MPLPQPGKSGARATEPRVTAAKAAQGRGASGMGSSRIFTSRRYSASLGFALGCIFEYVVSSLL
jgi:hypothetical protein